VRKVQGPLETEHTRFNDSKLLLRETVSVVSLVSCETVLTKLWLRDTTGSRTASGGGVRLRAAAAEIGGGGGGLPAVRLMLCGRESWGSSGGGFRSVV